MSLICVPPEIVIINFICIFCGTGASELPLLDYPLRQLFHLLGVQSVLDVFTGMLLEQQILFYSCGQYISLN